MNSIEALPRGTCFIARKHDERNSELVRPLRKRVNFCSVDMNTRNENPAFLHFFDDIRERSSRGVPFLTNSTGCFFNYSVRYFCRVRRSFEIENG